MRKHDLVEVAVATRPGAIFLFASPAPPAQENLDLCMAITFQRREKASHNVSKRLPKTEPEYQNADYADIVLSSILNVFCMDLDAKGTRNVHTKLQ